LKLLQKAGFCASERDETRVHTYRLINSAAWRQRALYGNGSRTWDTVGEGAYDHHVEKGTLINIKSANLVSS